MLNNVDLSFPIQNIVRPPPLVTPSLTIPKSVSLWDRVSPSPHLLFFQFLIWSSSGRLASCQWKSGENNKVAIFTLKIFQFGMFQISTWCGFGTFKTFGWRWVVLIWLTSPIFMVIISWKHNRWIVGLFEGLIVVGWWFDIYNRQSAFE